MAALRYFMLPVIWYAFKDKLTDNIDLNLFQSYRS